MKILTMENASELLGGKPLDSLVSELSTQLRLVGHRYSIPPDSEAKLDLSGHLEYLLLRGPNVCIYISDWGMSRDRYLDLFHGYRRSFGDNRFLIEAPVHLFESSEKDTFFSILCMVFYFGWDAWIFDIEGRVLVRIHHHAWLEVRTNDEKAREEFESKMDKFKISFLRGNG